MGWEKAASLPFRWRKFNLIEGNVLVERPLVGFHVATRTDAEPDSATSRINDKNTAQDLRSFEFKSHSIAYCRRGSL